MEVSFIIPLYNCLALTQAMRESLRATLPAGLEHEVIFVDDGSTDGTRPWLAGLPAPARFLLNERNLGFAGACNRAAAAARGRVLVFLNNDLVLLPGWLPPILAAFRRFPDAGLVGNIQLDAATGRVDHAGIFFNHKGKPQHDTGLPATTRWLGFPAYRQVDAVTGACFAVRRATWEQLGPFDEGFVNGSEDVDLALRLQVAGRRHYVALRSVVRHHISASTGRKLRDEQNTARLVRRWQERISVLAARDWSRHFIEQHWDQSCVFDDRLARIALFYWLGLLPAPPPALRHGTQAAIGRELARWERILPG